MACGFVTLLLLYSPALLFPPSFVPHFLSSLIFLPPATQAIIQKTTCMQQFTKWLLLPTLLWLYVKSSGTVHVRSKHPLVHENTSSATTDELWINRCLCLVFKNYTSMHDYSVLTSRRGSLCRLQVRLCGCIGVGPGQRPEQGRASAHREPSVHLLLLLLPPSDQRTA